MREPQKVKGFRFPFAPLLPVLARKPPKFQKTRFLRVQFQVELFHPFLQFSQEPLGFRLCLESHHHVVSKPHHDHFSAGDLPPPGLAPLVKGVMKVHVRQQWRCAATLGCSLFAHRQLSLFQHARSQPFLDESHHAPVPNPVFHELHQPFLRQTVEKGSDVHVHYPVHFLLLDPQIELVQRIMLASPRTVSIREIGKVLFVDGIHNLHRGPLDNLVLQRRHAERSHPPVALGYESPAHRLGSIRSSLQSMGKILEVRLEVLSVVLPRLPIHAGRRFLLQSEVSELQHFQVVDVVEQRGESLPLISPPSFPYPPHPTHPLPPPLRPHPIFLSQVPLAPTPSLHPLLRCWSRFVRGLLRHYGPVRLPVFVHHQLLSLDFPMRPEPLLLGRTRDLPVPVHSASLRARVFDLAGPLSASRFRRSRCCLPHIARASASRSNEFSRLNCPARTFPCQRFGPSLAACAA